MKRHPSVILIVEDEKNLRDLTAEFLAQEGFRTLTAANGLAGQKQLREEPVDAVILDLKMPGMTGLELLTWLQEEGPDIPALMMSAFGEVEDAVNAMKRGARDYLVKPFDPEELVIKLEKALEEHRKNRLLPLFADDPRSPSTPEGENPASRLSPAMAAAEALIRKGAPSEATILITGESGTGKEVTARRIHQLSPRRRGPFTAINLGGIPESLLESELFGYEKGAFTGADRRKPGHFEAAGGGTLFLDEIGDLPLNLQVKILRALQERKIHRLGGTAPIPVDVRILAATNRNLEEAVEQGLFREDLYYRLNVIRIQLPPLRDRVEEIPRLTELFIERHSRRQNRSLRGIRQDALDQLMEYPFPGNIRELENMIERALILAEEDILRPEDFNLPAVHPPSTEPASPGSEGSLKALEREAISQALLRHEGRKQETAAELGISRRTLLNKIKEYGLYESGEKS